jgi:hypothetical protein
MARPVKALRVGGQPAKLEAQQRHLESAYGFAVPVEVAQTVGQEEVTLGGAGVLHAQQFQANGEALAVQAQLLGM